MPYMGRLSGSTMFVLDYVVSMYPFLEFYLNMLLYATYESKK